MTVRRLPIRFHFVALLATVVGACSGTESVRPRPFTTDGCSAFPDGTPAQSRLWLNCCIRHDFAYWAGGTYEDRKRADNDLETCVTRVGEPEIAGLMLAGVRVGGTPFLPTRFRWGYGWPYPRGYRELTESERSLVNSMAPADSSFPWDPKRDDNVQ